jgi:ribonuclease HII
MTVDKLAQYMTTNDLCDEVLEQISRDPRRAVARLLEQWRKRQAARQAELDRLEVLHSYEKVYFEQGLNLVAGVDEAGRGPLAGPVVIAAVILPQTSRISGINDSKKLSAKQREDLYTIIRSEALAVNYEVINPDVIDRINIYQAALSGMYQALAGLNPKPQAALIDAMPLNNLTIPYQSLIHGDQLSASIAAASIIAKVERDRIMDELDKHFPKYGFSHHKGYATPEHLAAIERYGPCAIHRRSFAPIKTWGDLFNESC